MTKGSAKSRGNLAYIISLDHVHFQPKGWALKRKLVCFARAPVSDRLPVPEQQESLHRPLEPNRIGTSKDRGKTSQGPLANVHLLPARYFCSPHLGQQTVATFSQFCYRQVQGFMVDQQGPFFLNNLQHLSTFARVPAHWHQGISGEGASLVEEAVCELASQRYPVGFGAEDTSPRERHQGLEVC